MIPIRDHNPTRTTPYITHLLICVNVVAFLFMMFLTESQLEDFIYSFAFIPREIASGDNIATLFTSMFLHGGIGHIFGNMIFLHIFGDNLEDTLGHFAYLAFYLLAGLAGSLAKTFVNPASIVPNIGASGAIAGLMGGYLTLFPKHKVDVILPIFDIQAIQGVEFAHANKS